MKPKEKGKDSILIKVSRPCKEDFDQMEPAEQGRFCSLCEKVVIDFTALSDQQIAALIASNPGKKFCGHFNADQLNRQINASATQSPIPDTAEQKTISPLLFTLKEPPPLTDKPLRSADTTPMPHQATSSGLLHYFLNFFK